MIILAIESSCDETSIAVSINGNIASNIISSQLFHSNFGGVIPELASRAHIQNISFILKEALANADITMNDVDAIAVTTEPGLVGSLIVGSNFAKGLSIKHNLPVVPVNHIEGHLYSGFLENPDIVFPVISLVVSGGHTALFRVDSFNEKYILGLTLDDAAGEAFDKTAKLLGLPYPGGPEIDKLAKKGNPDRYKFPRSMLHSDDFNFSFSGLKTSVRYFINKEFSFGNFDEEISDIAASVQEAIVDVLIGKSIRAAIENKIKWLIVAGGVSANSRLRAKLKETGTQKGINTIVPDMSYCMDNAAMIAFLGEKKLLEKGSDYFKDLDFTVNASALRAKRKK